MKKFLSIFLAAMMIFCFCACKKTGNTEGSFEDEEYVASDYFADEGGDTEIIEDEDPVGDPEEETSEDTPVESETESADNAEGTV